MNNKETKYKHFNLNLNKIDIASKCIVCIMLCKSNVIILCDVSDICKSKHDNCKVHDDDKIDLLLHLYQPTMELFL